MLSFYEVDWQDVVRQCYDALRRRNEWYAANGKMVVPTQEPAMRTIYYGDNNLLPQTLLLDRRLTPLERNTWQVLRWLITERQVKAPRYQDLQPYLATSPCGNQASRETIARALNVLRTTRWLILVERSRDANGCLRGCVYVLHGDPLTATEQLELDGGYAALLQQNLSHATKGVRDVAKHVIAEIQADPQVAQIDKDSLGSLPPAQQQTLPLMSEEADTKNSEPGVLDLVRDSPAGATDCEPCGNAPDLAVVRNADAGRTVQKDQSKKSTVLGQVEFGRARWPEDLPLNPNERRMASQAMRQLEPEQQQAVINEAAVRCARGEIRKLFTVFTFVVRLAVLTLATPLFLLAVTTGAVDGLIRRDLRKFGAGRESSFVYHRAKRTLFPLMVSPWVIYLSLPLSLNPIWVLLPCAAVLGWMVAVTAATFKKYL